MTPLANLAAQLRKALPQAQITVAEPAAPGGVGFLDVAHAGNVVAVQWRQSWHFGVSSPESHGYGEKPDETYRTADDAAARIVELLQSGGRTEPPLEVTLRKLRRDEAPPGGPGGFAWHQPASRLAIGAQCQPHDGCHLACGRSRDGRKTGAPGAVPRRCHSRNCSRRQRDRIDRFRCRRRESISHASCARRGVLAITARLPSPLPDDYVLLPWASVGKCPCLSAAPVSAVAPWQGMLPHARPTMSVDNLKQRLTFRPENPMITGGGVNA